MSTNRKTVSATNDRSSLVNDAHDGQIYDEVPS